MAAKVREQNTMKDASSSSKTQSSWP